MLCQPSLKSGWKINTPVQNIHPCAVEWGAAVDGGGGDGVLIATDRCTQVATTHLTSLMMTMIECVVDKLTGELVLCLNGPIPPVSQKKATEDEGTVSTYVSLLVHQTSPQTPQTCKK